MSTAILLFFVGLILSAFFSGSETGMYRVSRIRLVLDGLSGGRVARGLVLLLNNPALFVATTLVGNNIANYVVSLGIVMASAHLWPGEGAAAELLGPMLLTPVVFVLGELLPKYLFYHAPYRLIRLSGAPFLLITVVLLPLTILLGLLGRLLSLLTGETPFRVRLTMARSELEQVLREGQEAGILSSSQRVLAQNVFHVGNQPAIRYGVNPDRFAVVDVQSTTTEALRAARRQGHPIVLVKENAQIVGYYWYADLAAASDLTRPEWKRVITGLQSQKHFSVLLELCETGSDVALLLNQEGSLKSVVTRRQLLQPLLTPMAT